jgi:broad specificity phosphatase PhoE
MILIRHGETDWNNKGRWQGQEDVPLNQHGHHQALEVANTLVNTHIDAVYASDLTRAVDTARPLAQVAGLPIQLDSRLREIHQGEWQGLLISEIQRRYADLFKKRAGDPFEVAPPGGETAGQVWKRVHQVLHEIVKEHPNATVAIVSHGFVLAVARVYFENKPLEYVWEMAPLPGEILFYTAHPEHTLG